MESNAKASGAGGVEETSPDMLKNTPLNIMRLANEIEHCEARQKYLAHTGSPSDGGDVRWYFCKVPLAVNELAASIPQTEIVGKGDYFRFGMRDSLAVEASFLQREDELLSSWWKEYAECSEGPRGTSVISKSTLQTQEMLSGSPESDQLYATDEERVGVPVKGGLYEVDLVRRHCFPVYWNGENRRVLRGHWFARKCGFDWLPLREDVSEQLEYAYRTQVWRRRTFQLSGLFAARVDLQGPTPGLHALFTGEDDTWEAWLSVDASGFSGVVGFGGNGIKLRRGYAPSQSQKPTQVSIQLNKLYLKFLKRNPGYDGKVSIYGHSLGSVLSYDILCHQETLYSPFPMEWMYIEQKRNDAPCSVRDNLTSSNNPISNFRDESSDNVESETMVGPVDCPDLLEERVEGTFNPLGPPASSESDVSSTTDIGYQPTNDASLLDGNTNEPFHNSYDMEYCKSDLINEPNSMRTDAVLCDDSTDDRDISDNSKAETIKLLMEEIDLLKAKVKEFEAECAGQVNAKKSTTVANQSDPERVRPEHKDFFKSYTPQIRYTKLEFKVDTFFAVGSPLGVFLSLRNVRIGIGKGKEYWKEENTNEEMPACRQMLNIFHPFDPVAYRIEPLICKEFIHKPPVIIPYHRGGKRLYVVFQEFKEGLASHSQALRDHLSTIRVKVLTLCESRCNDERDEQSENTQEKEERPYGSVMMDRLTGSNGGRIDHVLQDKTFRHPYVSAIGAHTNYWRDHDTALFMLKHLYKDIPEEPILSTEQPQGSSKDENSLKGWSDPREVADEELPLTFADSVFIKHFSHKVKKMSKN